MTGRRLAVVLSLGEGDPDDDAPVVQDEQLSGEDVVALLKTTLGATEVEDET